MNEDEHKQLADTIVDRVINQIMLEFSIVRKSIHGLDDDIWQQTRLLLKEEIAEIISNRGE